MLFLDFYDPDGYYFDVNGFDEFGGHYEGDLYFPGEKNKHEFEDLYYDEEEDELVKQFERGHDDDDQDEIDEIQERYF
jgi:hypothetical protein